MNPDETPEVEKEVETPVEGATPEVEGDDTENAAPAEGAETPKEKKEDDTDM